MKHLAFCFDGTWNTVTHGNPTNVSKIAHAITSHKDDIPQITYYDEGVGTLELGKYIGPFVNKISGALGFGLQQNIIEAYTSLILNYEPGDKIFVFGFSRGAFTARSFVGLIRNAGILPKRRLFNIRELIERYTSRAEDEHPSSHKSCELRYKFCPHLLLPGDREWRTKLGTKYDGETTELTIAYLGVWDTVGALGLPNRFGLAKRINRKYGFHDTRLSKFVEAARHAVAVDEKRRTFEPALWSNLDELNDPENPVYLQRLFPGTHSAVGGGGPHIGLSDGPLEWIFRGAKKAGLGFDTAPGSPLYGLLPDHRAPLFNAIGKTGWTWGDRFVGAGLAPRNFSSMSVDQIDPTVHRRWHDPSAAVNGIGNYRPEALKPFEAYIDASPPTTKVDLSNEIFADIRHSDRHLKTPVRVIPHVVQAEDRWKDISMRYYGTPDMWKAIFIYNFDQCILYDPDQLYVSQQIQIPIFAKDPPSKVAPSEISPT